jgi:hypothetical protein
MSGNENVSEKPQNEKPELEDLKEFFSRKEF